MDADEHQLQRVITNLLVNARDAVGSKGVIRLSARRFPTAGAQPIEIVVSDDGKGIEPEVQRRMFEPFFTTKTHGEGTGLGLVIAHGFVESHGAEMHVDSTPGVGTFFRILWPSGSARHMEPLREPNPCPPEAIGNVLVAEDEPLVRRLVCTALERAGIRVVVANDGEAALAEFEKYAAEIDAALLDLSMPGLTGLEVVHTLRARRPTLAAMIVSGHHLREDGDDWPAGVPLLQKPFSPRDLVARVSELLAGQAT